MDASFSEPLFLFDNDSDVEFVAPDRTAQSDPVQEELPVTIEPPQTTVAFDLETYRKESLARHRKEINKTKKPVVISESVPAASAASGSKTSKTAEKSEEKKPRQKPKKLDEGLLLSPKGFPQLIKMTKGFQIKGKGHEATDLDRLLQVYHFWTHQLYPKMQFRDNVLHIEKLCHSRRMMSALSVWRDEAHGKVDADVLLSEEEQVVADQDQEMTEPASARLTTPPTGSHSNPPSSPAASHPPTSDVESEPNQVADNVSDADMDAMIQEYANEPQDTDMWQDPDSLEEFFAASAPPAGPETATVNSDVPLTDGKVTASSSLEEEEDWGEDMYI